MSHFPPTQKLWIWGFIPQAEVGEGKEKKRVKHCSGSIQKMPGKHFRKSSAVRTSNAPLACYPDTDIKTKIRNKQLFIPRTPLLREVSTAVLPSLVKFTAWKVRYCSVRARAPGKVNIALWGTWICPAVRTDTIYSLLWHCIPEQSQVIRLTTKKPLFPCKARQLLNLTSSSAFF